MARESASAVGGVWKNGEVVSSDKAGAWCCSTPSMTVAAIIILMVMI
jgi:hypothetical protein